MSRKISLGAAITLAIVVAAVTVSLTYVYAMNKFNDKMVDINERQTMYAKLSEVDQKVRQDYVGELDETKLLDSICTGYMAGLGDAQAQYISAEKYLDYQSGSQGTSTGVGVLTVQDEDGNMEIIDVMPGSPAELSGLKKGDVIVSVDDKEIVRLTYGEAVNRLNGTAGTVVKLGVLRPAVDEDEDPRMLSVSITRAEYTHKSISSEVIYGNVGYLKITAFRENSVEQFEDELSALLQQNVSGLVIDLRNNSGGDMAAAAKILDRLLPACTTVSSKDKTGAVRAEYTSKSNEIALPIAVLVNERSFGTAELFAADIQESKKGLAVGRNTPGYGKKIEMVPLSDGSAISFSVAEYLTLTGKSIDGVGVVVDMETSLTEEQDAKLQRNDLPVEEDAQIAAAIAALQTQGVTVQETIEDVQENSDSSSEKETDSKPESQKEE